MSNEELFYLLQKFYPGTINGTHYLTGHRLDTEGQQLGEAFLQYWRLPDPEPSRGTLLTWWGENRTEIQDTIAGVHLRWERAERLLKADALVYRAEDAGDEAKTAAARKYRQALRDVPQQAGFPHAFAWPVPPEEDEVQNVAKRDAVLREVEKAAANPHAVHSMPDDLQPLAEHEIIMEELPPPPPPMQGYGTLEEPTAPPAAPEAPGGGDDAVKPIVPVLTRPDVQDDLPHPPDQLPPLPDIPVGPVPDPVPPPFTPSPQPGFMGQETPALANEIALSYDPAAKLRAFLTANPDVMTFIEENVPPAPVDPEAPA